MKQKRLFHILLILVAVFSFEVFIPPDNMYVGLFRNLNVQELSIQINTGAYRVLADGKILANNDRKNTYHIERKGKKIKLSIHGEWLGDFSSLHFVSDYLSELKVTLHSPSRKSRIYHHNIMISPDSISGLLIINEVDLDRYIAGVTEAEAGRRSHPEFYKAQSVLARTFALSQINKHIQEGFYVCDQEHCQVYYGKPKDFSVFTAVEQTRNLIVVDKDMKPIVATFHSNSGGQTANSEDVWGKYIPYLRSKVDSFSTCMPNYKWQRKIPLNEWLNYLKTKHGIDFTDSVNYHKATHFEQRTRMCCMEIGNKKIPLKIIREDLKLKSTFFTVTPYEKDTLLFTGKGFGHGVGLCQEGAMKMAKSGFTYEEILHYYYTDIHIVPISSLTFFKDE